MRTVKHLIVEGDKAQTYENHASYWLAEANLKTGLSAEKLYDKAQYWLDRANKERNWQ